MSDKCLNCNRKAVKTNVKNLVCKKCKKICHQNCAKFQPSFYIKKIGFRHKVIRNDWYCEICNLAELPCANISDSQIRNMIPANEKTRIPSPQELNGLFVNDKVDNDEDFYYNSNNSKYMYTQDLQNLNFENEGISYESFPIISVNIRSIVNSKNFTKFESLLESLPIKPLVIAISESWATKSSKGAFTKIPGYHEFIQNSRSNTVGGGVGF